MVGPDFIETKLHHVISRQKQSIRRNDKARAEAGATPFPVRLLVFEQYLNGLGLDVGPGEINTTRLKLIGARDDFAPNQRGR